jgi:hypothetical protein
MFAPAAAFTDWNDPLPAEERERLLDKLAKAVVGRGLETPAILALEMHKPLAFLGAQTLIVATPMLGPLLGLERMQTLSRLLNEPGSVDALVRRIDEVSAARARRPEATATAATTEAPSEEGND